jgi:starvation-inducible DNA-binding protein
MIENLLSDYETIIRNIREDIVNVGDKFKDLGTADFLTELMVKHEKTAWMLRSFLS